jgi:hypothetical protein
LEVLAYDMDPRGSALEVESSVYITLPGEVLFQAFRLTGKVVHISFETQNVGETTSSQRHIN